MAVFLIYLVINRKKEPEKILMIDTINMNFEDVKQQLKNYNIDINVDYKYDETIAKDKIISQSIDKDTEIRPGDKLDLVVSLGKIDKEKCIFKYDKNSYGAVLPAHNFSLCVTYIIARGNWKSKFCKLYSRLFYISGKFRRTWICCARSSKNKK